MRFRDRTHAARMLADRLLMHRGERPLVLAMPRGAVPMARYIADALDGDLDVVLVHKLHDPRNAEITIGAIDEAGTVLRTRRFDGIPDDDLHHEVLTQAQRIRAQRTLYAKGHTSIDPAGRTVIIVDDGIATGASMLSAIRAVRARRPLMIVVAVAVADREALAAVRREADDVVSLAVHDRNVPIRDCFEIFEGIDDVQVVRALRRGWDLAA